MKEFYSPGYHTYDPKYLQPFSKLQLIEVPEELEPLMVYHSARIWQQISLVSKDHVVDQVDMAAGCEYGDGQSLVCEYGDGTMVIESVLDHDQWRSEYGLFDIAELIERLGDKAWLVQTKVSPS